MSVSVQLQTNNKTFLGRHWTEHTILRRYKPSDKDLSILSFGCSTGEELATLRILFPAAKLFGCDIDWVNLQSARALLGDSAVIFHSSDAEITRHGPFDLVLCNSVLLRHTEVVNGRKQGVNPAFWMDALATLDSALKPGGIMQIINSNIPFRYHRLAANYQAIRSPLIFGPNFVDQFDPAGNHLCSGVGGAGWSAILNRHLGEEAWKQLLPSDLQDIHFQKKGGEPVAPIEDEVIPNLPGGDCWASGSMTYRPRLAPDSRPSTHTEIDLTWATVGVDNIRLNRQSRRIWFDGSIVSPGDVVVHLPGAAATAFIEASTGRRSSRLTMDALIAAQAIRPPAF